MNDFSDIVSKVMEVSPDEGDYTGEDGLLYCGKCHTPKEAYCPYAVNRHLVQQTTWEYDESGNQTLQQTMEHNTAEFVECKKESCGAWHDGKCRYNQVD